MKSYLFVLATAGLAALPAGAVDTPMILTSSQVSFVMLDGEPGLYVKMLEDGTRVGDVGSVVRDAQDTFTLNLAVADQNGACCGLPQVLVAKRIDDTGTYQRLNMTPYIDVSEGAVAPLRFTSDKSSLKEGETAAGWMNVHGFLMWSPTGRLVDVPPAPVRGTQAIHAWQGYQLIKAEKYPGVYQVFWNQTRFSSDAPYDHQDGFSVGPFFAVSSPQYQDQT